MRERSPHGVRACGARRVRVSLARRTSLYFCRELVLIPRRARYAAATPPAACARAPPPQPAEARGGISSGQNLLRGVFCVPSRESHVRPRHAASFAERVRVPGMCLGLVWDPPTPPAPPPDPGHPAPPRDPQLSRTLAVFGRVESCAVRHGPVHATVGHLHHRNIASRLTPHQRARCGA